MVHDTLRFLKLLTGMFFTSIAYTAVKPDTTFRNHDAGNL